LVLNRLDFLHAAERPRVRERLILADRWVRLPLPHSPGFLPQQSVRRCSHDLKDDRGPNASTHMAADWDDYRARMERERRALIRIELERAGPDRQG